MPRRTNKSKRGGNRRAVADSIVDQEDDIDADAADAASEEDVVGADAVASREGIKLFQAVKSTSLLPAKKKDWERVKVCRPLEAVSGTEYGPLQGVCLGIVDP